jgi:hypothetical protein
MILIDSYDFIVTVIATAELIALTALGMFNALIEMAAEREREKSRLLARN